MIEIKGLQLRTFYQVQELSRKKAAKQMSALMLGFAQKQKTKRDDIFWGLWAYWLKNDLFDEKVLLRLQYLIKNKDGVWL